LDQPGLYGICHFVNQDVFTSAAPSNSMYGDGNYISYRTDENCSLIRGWAKFTQEIYGPRIPCNMPNPCLAMFPVESIISTCIGIEDCQNPISHSYIFLPPWHEWPKLFHQHMIKLMEKEGHNIPEEYDYNDIVDTVDTVESQSEYEYESDQNDD